MRVIKDKFEFQESLKFRESCLSISLTNLQADGVILENVYSSLYRHYNSLGNLKYALGYSLKEVSEDYKRSCEYFYAILLCRGTSKGIDHLFIDGNKVKLVTGKTDYSLGNSKKTMKIVLLAFAIGEIELALKMAELIWDPDDATYMSGSYSTMNEGDQSIAYTLKGILLKKKANLLTPACSIKAIELGDQALFLKRLNQEVLDFATLHKNNPDDEDFIVDLNSSGVIAVARYLQFCDVDIKSQHLLNI